jgi:hypothetical protein
VPDRRAPYREGEGRREADRLRQLRVDAWRRTIELGANTAGFAAEDEVRCPATVAGRSGPAVCGAWLGIAEAPLRIRMLPREPHPARRPSTAVMQQRCPSCGERYRVTADGFPQAHAPPSVAGIELAS